MAQEPIQKASIPALQRYATPPIWVSLPRQVITFSKRKPIGAVGGVLMLFMIFLAASAPIISPYDPLEVHPKDRLSAPGSSGYIMGTDDLGRDMLSRTIHGARTSVTISTLAILFGTTAGALVGILSAYYGGKFDLLAQRVVDAMFAFPLLVFAMAIVAVLGQGFFNIIIALSIVLLPGTARVVRGTGLSVMEQQYIDAAKAMGAGPIRIMVVHLLPNVMAVIIVLATIQLGNAVIVEASLSFLGLGTPPPTPSWGGMLSGSGRRFLEIAPWLALVPGMAISLAVLGINLLGDAIRDVWDPRLRGSQ